MDILQLSKIALKTKIIDKNAIFFLFSQRESDMDLAKLTANKIILNSDELLFSIDNTRDLHLFDYSLHTPSKN